MNDEQNYQAKAPTKPLYDFNHVEDEAKDQAIQIVNDHETEDTRYSRMINKHQAVEIRTLSLLVADLHNRLNSIERMIMPIGTVSEKDIQDGQKPCTLNPAVRG